MASQSSNVAWYSITNKGDANEPAEILIYDVIGGPSWWEDTVSAKQFVSDLKDIGAKQDVVVRINSPGGNVLHGTAIFNALRAHKGTRNDSRRRHGSVNGKRCRDGRRYGRDVRQRTDDDS